MGREEHVRPQIHGDRAQHVPDRRERDNPRRLAQGQSGGPCRGGLESGPRPLFAASLTAGAAAILATADPAAKAALSRELAAAWRSGTLPLGGCRPPARPPRPARPPLPPPPAKPTRPPFRPVDRRHPLLPALGP